MRAEIVGGPLDGQFMEVPDGTLRVDFPISTNRWWLVEGVPQIEFDRVSCEVNPLGFIVWPNNA